MNIKLEPHKEYSKAIQKVRPNGRLVYNYWKLIEVTQDLYEMSPEDAIEWTDFNILGLEPNGMDVCYTQPGDNWKPAPTTPTGRAKKKKVK
jgi:hypothetical protein